MNIIAPEQVAAIRNVLPDRFKNEGNALQTRFYIRTPKTPAKKDYIVLVSTANLRLLTQALEMLTIILEGSEVELDCFFGSEVGGYRTLSTEIV